MVHPVRKQPSAIVLDIEGTVAPIDFVTQTLFPYAKAHVQEYLESTFDSAETQSAIHALRLQARAVRSLCES